MEHQNDTLDGSLEYARTLPTVTSRELHRRSNCLAMIQTRPSARTLVILVAQKAWSQAPQPSEQHVAIDGRATLMAYSIDCSHTGPSLDSGMRCHRRPTVQAPCPRRRRRSHETRQPSADSHRLPTWRLQLSCSDHSSNTRPGKHTTARAMPKPTSEICTGYTSPILTVRIHRSLDSESAKGAGRALRRIDLVNELVIGDSISWTRSQFPTGEVALN